MVEGVPLCIRPLPRAGTRCRGRNLEGGAARALPALESAGPAAARQKVVLWRRAQAHERIPEVLAPADPRELEGAKTLQPTRRRQRARGEHRTQCRC